MRIYPAFNARYYSLYLTGLYRVLGRERMSFSAEGFPHFGTDCMALRVDWGDRETKVYLHSNDFPELDPEGLEWCDVFGKVNLDPESVPEQARGKVLALGPTFAVKVWNRLAAEFRGLTNFMRSPRIPEGFREHMANYRGQYASRFLESTYQPGRTRGDYVFFNGALWERESEANRIRAGFIEACRSLDTIHFEGGLSPRKSAGGSKTFDTSPYDHLVCPRYTARDHFRKSRVSAVTLNNPAYRQCHTWRLAESLALGRAIVSIPIVRALPKPLVHGTHIHCVDGSDEAFRRALRTICGDSSYRSHLERNARLYYEANLSPTSVIRRILRAGAGSASSSLGRQPPETHVLSQP